MFTKHEFLNRTDSAAALDNLRYVIESTGGWTVDKYVPGSAGELYIHNSAGRYFTIIYRADPVDPAWGHLAMHGNTGFDAAQDWQHQPGRFTPIVDACSPAGYAAGVGQHVFPAAWPYGAISSFWLSSDYDFWVFINTTDLLLFGAGIGYAHTDLRDSFCLAAWLGEVALFDAAAGGSNAGAIVLGDYIGPRVPDTSWSQDGWPSSSSLLGRKTINPAYSLASVDAWNMGTSAGLLWRGSDILHDMRHSVTRMEFRRNTAYTSYTNEKVFLSDSSETENRALQYESALQYNSTFDRAALIPDVLCVLEEDDGEPCNYPIGQTPYYACCMGRNIKPGEILSMGERQFCVFPLFYAENSYGVAVRIA